MLKKIKRKIRSLLRIAQGSWEDPSLVLQARLIMSLSEWRKLPEYTDTFWLQKKEFRVYSQFGDDGIIQWLIYFLGIERGRFIEFGVGDFFESNTHFLLINNRFSGFVMDGSIANIDNIKASPIYWRYQLNAARHFIDKDNIQSLLQESGFLKIELLHIDLDGNDYWILDSLNLDILDPDILVLEYNAAFGKDRSITIPYDPDFYRMNAHFSGRYFGASLNALNDLAHSKGYYFIGCNSAGNNPYFLPNRFLSRIPSTNINDGFQEAGFRESRDNQGKLAYCDPSEEINQMLGMPVIDTSTDENVEL